MTTLNFSVNTGVLGEKLVARLYKSKSHSVLERGSRSGRLELDIFTRSPVGTYHLIEVKSSAIKICQCNKKRFTISDSLRGFLPRRFAFGWSMKGRMGDGNLVHSIDYRFDREKLFHMKQLAVIKIGKLPESLPIQIDFARVELCFLHKAAIITLFENIEI